MRQFLHIAFIGAFILPMLLKIMVLGNYLVAYETYLDRCENKAEVAMQCNGTCQLSKDLQQTSQEQEEAPELPRLLQIELLPFVAENEYTLALTVFSGQDAPFFTFSEGLLNTFIDIPVPPPLFVG